MKLPSIAEMKTAYVPSSPPHDAWDASERTEDTIAAIPKRFRWATLGASALALRVSPPTAVQLAEDALGRKFAMVLTGGAGNGKTSLGCALVRRMAKLTGLVGHYADCIELAYARKMHPLGKGEAPEVLAAMQAGVLFLDELGAETGVDQTIEQIIRARHNHERPTIYGTPHSAASLTGRYGDGVARRVYEGATIIELGKGAA